MKCMKLLRAAHAAGEFRFLEDAHTTFNVSDGLEAAADVSPEQKINARRAAAKHFFNKTCRNRRWHCRPRSNEHCLGRREANL